MLKALCVIIIYATAAGCTSSINYFHGKVPSWSYGVSGPEAPDAIDRRVKKFEVPEGSALVYIVKPGPKDLGHRLDSYLDGEDIGTIHRDQFMVSPVMPGEHRLKTTGLEYYERRTLLETNVRLVALRVAEIVFTAEPGKLYFFEQIYSPGDGSNYKNFTLRQLSLDEGKTAVLSMKLGKFNKYLYEYITPGHEWVSSPEPCTDGESHFPKGSHISCRYN